MATDVEFCVVVDAKAYEIVKVCGNRPVLGSWNMLDGVELKQTPSTNQWKTNVKVTDLDVSIKYRYFCCRYLYNSNNERFQIVTRWETHFEPRVVVLNGNNSFDVFGLKNDVVKIDEGWLTCQSELRLFLRGPDSLNFWDASLNNVACCNVKLTPLDFPRSPPIVAAGGDGPSLFRPVLSDNSNDSEPNALPRHTECLLSVMTDEICSYHLQPDFGRRLKTNDVFCYKVQTVSQDTLGFLFEIYSNGSSSQRNETENSDGGGLFKRIGFSYVSPLAFHDTFGVLSAIVLSQKSRPIGQLSFDYLTVNPLPPLDCVRMDMSRSFVRYWKKRATLDVGHRGMGCSYKKTAVIKENTIGSLNFAANSGADYVEFDVQLSKDSVPVLFHDFRLCLAVHKRNAKSDDFVLRELCLNELTLEELQNLKLFHHTKYLSKDFHDGDSFHLHEKVNDDDGPFPTLGEVLATIDSNVGFNIEVKYPMRTKDGVWESDNRSERNLYVDKILSEVFRNSMDQRRIVFSSFEPYICLLLKLKQNKYPVMFLTQGVTNRYPPFDNVFTNCSEIAVSFAASNQFLGVCFHSEELLKNADHFTRALKHNLVSFVWGDDLSSSSNIDYFKKLGLNGVIMDKINEFVPDKLNVFKKEQADAANGAGVAC